MKHILKYQCEAKNWNEALPIGNAFLGAMVYGDPYNNHFQLNEDSIWYGGPMNRNNPDAYKNLKKVRELLLNGKISEAESLLCTAFAGTPSSPRMYQTAGDLYIENEDLKNIDTKSTLPPIYNYERFLDIDNSVCGYSYSCDDKKITVSAFASNPANVIIIRFKAEGSGNLNLKIHLERGAYFDSVGSLNDSAIFLSGKLGSDELTFYEEVEAVSDGNVRTMGEYLFVNDAKEVVLFVTVTTSYRYYYPDKNADDYINDAKSMGYDSLYEEHLKDYHNLYKRSELNLTSFDENTEREDDLSNVPLTADLLEKSESNMKEIAEILFSYGKYLLISSSRDKSLPANLQGIWNKDFEPAWGSKFTININTEMNYWPAEISNLPECHLPLFELMKKMYENGTVTAKTMYGCKGWVAHHNTDIYGDTAPVDKWIPGSFWVMGAAWLCTHIWEHYEYTQDIVFLRDNFYLMKESAQFFFDFLIEKDGFLVTAPSVSPENTFILENGESGSNGVGCTMDNQILRDLFTDCIKAADVLDCEKSFRKKAEAVLCKLKPTSIGSDGRILEWEKEYKEAEPGHRHISHLYGLHPSNQITVDKTPELAEAARLTLKKRLEAGGGHTGWSRAWIINHYAKLWDEEKVYENLLSFAKNSLLPNFFDNHPPFQIDGNFGVCAGIVSMLVQSDEDRIVLLPALPKEFADGSVKGIKCVGNIAVDITWRNGEMTWFSLLSKMNTSVKVLYKNEDVRYELKKDNQMKITLKNGNLGDSFFDCEN